MENIELLKKLGLTGYEATVYLSLAKRGPSTVKEIVLDSKIPRTKSYEVLEKLARKNMIALIPVSPKKFKITNPEVMKEEIGKMDDSLNDLIKIIKEPKETEISDLFWVIRGRDKNIEKLAFENAKCQKEILGVTMLNVMLYKNMRILKEAVSRGVTIRFISLNVPGYEKILKSWMTTGAEIRVWNTEALGPFLPKMTIMDSEMARISLSNPEIHGDSQQLAIWTNNKPFALMLRIHFYNIWEKCIPAEQFLEKTS